MRKIEKEPYHSKAYHRFFEGYAESRFFDDKEKMHIRRIYVGCYYRRRLSDKKDAFYRVLYGLLYAAGLACFLYAGTRNTGAGLIWYTSIPVAFGLINAIWLAVPVCFNLTAKREMIVRRYRDSSEDLIRAALASAAVQLVNAAAVLASIVLVPEQDVALAWRCIACFFGSCAAYTVMLLTERSVAYDRIPSGNEPPHGASVIKFRDNF